ncbi:thiopeptide-type bacteriocin biosynthesis protein [Nocardia sp. NRRL S-836]|uniref:thiopeptide-type bacteriocin biosynthesis protein n=1 Tax=Nocardia sp. NRRL S-836 TaxID=1519492 RepID=UPI0007C7E0D9|nr:thiopeptide-type bacteriocin biosynthesis protein [Nocardia sp. NRRL S-836]
MQTMWTQRNLTFPGTSPAAREHHAVAHLSRVLTELRERDLALQWWFVRKGAWRIRYHITKPADLTDDPVHPVLTAGLAWTRDIYEPETHAFGGPQSMDLTHELFCQDSRFLLTYLATEAADRRERSLVLFTALMRAAELDPNEQGDVWAQVADYRPAASTSSRDPQTWVAFTAQVAHLLRGTARSALVDPGWLAAYTHAGDMLRTLRKEGLLTRGIRAVIALHIIFAWNRLGLTAPTQAELATAAKEAIFGPTPSDGERARATAAACSPRTRHATSLPGDQPRRPSR